MRRVTMSLAISIALAFVIGCGDETIVVQNNPLPFTNHEPAILVQGPEFPSSVNEALPADEFAQLYVVVADSDGVDDIAAVYLSVDSLIVRRVIVRPTDEGCLEAVYADFDTVDIDSLLLRTFDGRAVIPMEDQGGGLYRIDACTPPRGAFVIGEPCPFFPRFDRFPPELGVAVPRCFEGDEYLMIFGLYTTDEVFIRNLALTYADIEYVGIRITAIDASGARTSTSFGNVRVSHSTFAEVLFEPR